MHGVVVVGAGPAGCSAALALAARGIETMIVERKTLPRPKTCAGGLSPWALAWLERHGLLERVMSEAHAIGGARIWIGRGLSPIRLRGRLQAAVLPRARFDTLLSDAAREAGVVLREGVTARKLIRDRGRLVGLETDAGSIPADAVVIASGAGGRLSPPPLAHTDELFGIMTRYRGLQGLDDSVEFFLDGERGFQYGWVFPEGDEVANVGVCFRRGRGSLTAHVRLDRFLDGRLGARLTAAQALARVQAHPIRALAWPRRLVEDGTLYVGEAAGLVDPLTGEGIYNALRSGELAGRCLAARLRRQLPPTRTALAPYALAVGLRLTPRLAASAAVLALLRSPAGRPAAGLAGSSAVQRLVHHLYPRL